VGYADIQCSEVLQQPEWDNPAQVEHIRTLLAACAPLTDLRDIRVLRSELASVAGGEAQILQAGDCAEDPAECTAHHIGRKTAMIDTLATALEKSASMPTLRAGRIAGQFAKPRSNPTERIGSTELPVYRGHMVNGPEFTAESRRHDPLRILSGYMAASEIMTRLGWREPSAQHDGEQARQPGYPLWTSHEALLLDYEVPMIRESDDGERWLSSTHWPWIGERTRQVTGSHVALLASIGNPVACKVGPGVSPAELSELCARLDPGREPGRLTLISRLGADVAAERLPALVKAARSGGHPVIWLCDPMHGNSVTTPGGAKVRVLESILAEVRAFRRVFAELRMVPGGLHLETTPDDVTECLDRMPSPGQETDSAAVVRSASLCDPRLNPDQAQSVIAAWSA
jgi:3-deoxy-7-phosphoheptulonate synthase